MEKRVDLTTCLIILLALAIALFGEVPPVQFLAGQSVQQIQEQTSEISLSAVVPTEGALYGLGDDIITSVKVVTSVPSADLALITVSLNGKLLPASPTFYEREEGGNILDTGVPFPLAEAINGRNTLTIAVKTIQGQTQQVTTSFMMDNELPSLTNLHDVAGGKEFTLSDSMSGVQEVKAYAADLTLLPDPLPLGDGRYAAEGAPAFYGVRDNAGNVQWYGNNGEIGLGAVLQAYLPAPQGEATFTPPPQVEEGTEMASGVTCDYPQHFISLYLYDGSISGDKGRMEAIAEQNLERVKGFFQGALADINQQMKGMELCYPPITSTPISAITVGFEVNDPSIKGILVPLRYKSTMQIGGTGVVMTKVSPLFNSAKLKNAELILIGDRVMHQVAPSPLYFCGATYVDKGIMVISSQGNFDDLRCKLAFTYPFTFLLHEMGHSLGLDHSSYNNNVMCSEFTKDGMCDYNANKHTVFEKNQLLMFWAHLCGNPSSGKDAVQFKGQSGSFGVNIHQDSEKSQCGNGMIGDGEEGDSGSLRFNDYCITTMCPVPGYPDLLTTLDSSCHCQLTVGSGGSGTVEEDSPNQQPPGGSNEEPLSPTTLQGCGWYGGVCGGVCNEGFTCESVINPATGQLTCDCLARCGNGKKDDGEECDPPGSVCGVMFQETPDGGCAGGPVYCSNTCTCDIPPNTCGEGTGGTA